MVGYGSTLRNVGRVAEAIALHRQAIADYPEFVPHHAFLALALHSAGEYEASIAAAFTALLVTGSEKLDGYDRALTYYRDLLDGSESA